MKHLLKVIILSVIFGTWGCVEKHAASDSGKYVKQAFDSIKTFSIHRTTYNFDSLESEVLDKLSDTSNRSEIHNELKLAIKAIDKHSYMLTKEEFENLSTGKDPETMNNPFPFEGKILEEKYAYISLDGFMGMDSISSDNYTDSLQRIVKNLYNKKPLGWIIDLRFNDGGWPYPMIAGLGPILGEGVKAYKISPDENITEFFYAKSKTEYIELSDSVFYLPIELPVALLISKGTGSAAELLALAFKGNPSTVLIGEPTYGVPTGLRGFFMPDSVLFAVTNSIMTDRYKNGNGNPIEPDIYANNVLKGFELAYEWIEKNKE